MMRRSALSLLLLALIVTGAAAQPTEQTRSFLLGFTPFPYEISFEAVTWTYERLAQDGDLIVHHFDNGVPWTEALRGEPYSQHIREDWNLRLGLTQPDQPVLATVTPINFLRDGLAAYRGEQDDMPLPAPFDSYTFDHPDVIAAFINYAESVIEAFEPDYLLFGIEVNLLMKIRPDLWDAYMVLHRETYTTLKERHPDLPVFVSVTGIDLLPGYTEANSDDQRRALADISEYTDLLALSIYPYMTAYMTNAIPTQIYEQLAELTDLPLAISETGYPAQSFRIDMGQPLEFNGTPELQRDWIALTLAAAEQYNMRFVVNFVLRDYDALWEAIGAQEDLTIAWRDTGLYAEDGTERPALTLWRDWLALPYGEPE